MQCCCRTSLIGLLAVLLAGYSKSDPSLHANEFSTIRLVSAQDEVSEPRLAGLIPAADLIEHRRPEGALAEELSLEPQDFPHKNGAWTFPSDNPDRVLLRLPAVDVTPTSDAPLNNSQPTESEQEAYQPIAALLPPQPLEMLLKKQETDSNDTVEAEPGPVVPLKITAPTAEQILVAAVIRDCPAATTGVPTDQRVNELAKTKIRAAYAMANRGGYYAARQELIEVLRMISHAKDAQQGVRERAEALAHGLRALDEAEDFAPRGVQLEADLAIDVICASHRTPIAKQIGSQDKLLPHQMMNAYFRYAQLKLAAAVAGEPAGSMALHALGKLATQLGQVEPEKHRLSQRRAIAFQQAALLAHSENHLAAHELATLLADAGYFAEAENLLRQVATRDPNAVVLRNLALMQEKLGFPQQALANRALANRLARQGASGTNNVQWISPQDFSRTGGTVPTPATAAARPALIRPPGRPPQQVPVAQPVWR